MQDSLYDLCRGVQAACGAAGVLVLYVTIAFYHWLWELKRAYQEQR